MALLPVPDLTYIDRVSQQLVKSSAREPASSGPVSLLRYAYFRHDASPLQLPAKLPDAAKFQIALINKPDRVGFGVIGHQLPLAYVITERRHPSHPHAFLLGGRGLVPNSLAG